MINIMILCSKNDLAETIKKEIRKCIYRNLYIHHEWKKENIQKERMKYLFLIVDIDEYGNIPDQFKSQEKWRNTYYIYISRNLKSCYKAIGYNVMGYVTYDQLDSFNQQFKTYLTMIMQTFDCYFKTEDGIEAYRYNEILYFEMKNRHLMMQTIYGQEYLINYRLADILEITDYRFLRINRSVILNIDYINKITYDHLAELSFQQIQRSFKISNQLYLDKKTGTLHKLKQT